MTAPAVIPREVAFANARQVFDRACARIARDRAAGRLSPEAELKLRRLERQQRRSAHTAQHRAAA
ncbi:hypothetical protein [Streptomyces sp. bgisy027]|uniref:hypothetical protein n=1 Tax=Streptomyces sp. bgisy027 TaxID=3413770 RepID=UPI003D75B960